jgi:hypothetical protein
LGTHDLTRHLLAPLLSQAVASLSDHLPITDVAQVEFSLPETAAGDLRARIQTYHSNAVPLLSTALAVSPSTNTPRKVSSTTTGVEQHSFLLIPASESGKQFGEVAKELLPDVHLVHVPGQADLMFCREYCGLSAEDLERILSSCRAAYEETAHAPTVSPHSRFDIQDWTPLDP